MANVQFFDNVITASGNGSITLLILLMPRKRTYLSLMYSLIWSKDHPRNMPMQPPISEIKEYPDFRYEDFMTLIFS